MPMKVTRHAAMWISDPENIPQGEMVEVDQDISDYLMPLFEDYVETDTPFESNCLRALYGYLYEIDPIGIRDDQAQNTDEYLYEAGAIFWLIKTDRLTTKAIWAIFVFYFDREISPFKDEDDPKLMEIFIRSQEIYSSTPQD